jgi:hypothetical protein
MIIFAVLWGGTGACFAFPSVVHSLVGTSFGRSDLAGAVRHSLRLGRRMVHQNPVGRLRPLTSLLAITE